jgi:uncharacterized protein
MTHPVFPLRAAAALFLERQHLRRPRSRRFSAKTMLAFIEDVGGLQIDSINVVDRAHYLTVWSRFDLYNRAALDRMTYRRHALIEYWAHAACFVPASHYRAWRRAMLDYRRRHRGWSGWLRKHRRVLDAVEARIREQGPAGTSDFEHAPGSTTGWWNWKPAAHALDYLWMTGRTMVHSRRHFQKRYDLTERLLPGAMEAEALTEEEFELWHLRRSLRAMGAATEPDLRLYLTFPRNGAVARRRALARALKRGEVVEVRMAGDRARWYALPEDLGALAAAGRRRRAAEGVTILSPFDSLMWHRERVSKLFGFDYRIEVYVPQPKRVYGYYVLPVLADGHFVGRMDVKTHRDQSRLEVRALHFEPWFAKGNEPPGAIRGPVERDATLVRLGEAVHSLATFTGSSRVTLGRVTPASMARPARREIAGA